MKKWVFICLVLAACSVHAVSFMGCSETINITTVDDFSGKKADINCYLDARGGESLHAVSWLFKHEEVRGGVRELNETVYVHVEDRQVTRVAVDAERPTMELWCPQDLVDRLLQNEEHPLLIAFIHVGDSCDIDAVRVVAVPKVSVFKSFLVLMDAVRDMQSPVWTLSGGLNVVMSSAKILTLPHYFLITFIAQFVGVLV
ncbi:hypothetical protein GF342_05770 [Candidatus Woesearchaeota archaeon]|nr:hypothetical protein [Candidatus Woesearchaeota archaeon]